MKTVLITGASSGIGRDAALYFNQRGYTVFAGVRKAADSESVRAQAQHPDALRPVRLDVTDSDQVRDARATVSQAVGAAGLDVLVSNAGIAALGGPSSCEGCPLETQQRVMDVNFFGAVRVVQAFLPMLRASRGTIVLNTALMAHTVIPYNAGYAASKAALEAWADSLRREVGPLGVRVAMLEAAYLATELEGKQAPAPSESDAVYPLQHALLTGMAGVAARMADSPKASPRRMSEAMVAAAEADHPKPRRIIGGGARPIWVVGLLPDRVQDRIFAAALPRLARRSTPAPVDRATVAHGTV